MKRLFVTLVMLLVLAMGTTVLVYTVVNNLDSDNVVAASHSDGVTTIDAQGETGGGAWAKHNKKAGDEGKGNTCKGPPPKPPGCI